MIQRIQSVYLLLTAILMAVSVFSPFIRFADLSELFLLNGLTSNYTMDAPSNINFLLWIGAGIATISTIIGVFNLFGFKNRKKQIIKCNIISCLIILLYIILSIYFLLVKDIIGIDTASFKYGVILPLIALIFNLLAASKIKADEKLVQSLNRIR